jgi:serine/threonine protein kinase
MGEVYKARDTRLERTVAVKVLPADVASDPAARERFEREARAVAALNHPHICVLHDIGRHEGTDFLVMEYLEGETLGERLARGAVSLPQALEYGAQIADALDKAHRAGIVHRDLKPRNIMLTSAGAKLLDFGLAKWRPVSSSGDSVLPTRDLTAQGAIVGTLQYMAPEQLEGKEADSRADLWALGLVLYEMVTGRKAFEGKSQASLIAAILEHEPEPLEAVQPLSPRLLNRVVQRCLAKDPSERAQSAADVRAMLRWVSEGTPEVRPARRRRDHAAWALSSLLFLGFLSSLGFFFYRSPSNDSHEMRLQVVTPPTIDPISMAISPDGSRLVFVGSSEGKSRLWLRPLQSETAQPLTGTEGASYPFWSPDSRSIAFFAEGKLRRIDIAGGLAQALASVARGMGGTWNRDGVIVFGIAGGPLYRVPAAGGEPAALTRLDRGHTGHRFPQFLPDGRHFVFFVGGGSKIQGIYVASLDPLEARRVLNADTAAAVAPGHLLFGRGETLVAQPFDSETLELSGDPFPVAEQVAFDDSLGQGTVGAISASANGVLAYRSGTARGGRRLIWFDRVGTALAPAGVIESSSIANPELSPDGRRVALNRIVGGNNDIWVLETARGVLSRLTFDSGLDHSPLWSPDGSRLAFFSSRAGVRGLVQKLASGAGAEKPLHSASAPLLPTDWSPDGRFILFRELQPQTGYDLWILPVSHPVGDRKPVPFVNSIYQEREGKFSPDGQWVAYQSDESGRFEVYVQAFPGPGAKSLVSTEGGAQPRWRADGRELFYIGLDGKLMAAPITLAEGGQRLEAGTPVALFLTSIAGGPIPATGPFRHQYAVAQDGQRFLINVATEEAVTSPITLVLHWKPGSPSKP